MGILLKAPEVAATLGVSAITLRRWCHDGKGPKFWKTPGGTIIFDSDDVQQWKAARQGPHAADLDTDSPSA